MAVNTDLTKRPYQTEKMSQSELRELALCSINPLYFIRNHCYIQHPTKGRMAFELFDYQEELINSYNDYRYSISLLSRQTGKSTCAAAYLLWFAMFTPDSTILVAAHKRDGAGEIMARLRYMYESCPDSIRAGVTAYNKGSIEFDNGSKIIAQATTENTGRGLSLSLVYLDEFAFVPPRVAEEFWTSISPTLSTGGKCIITSTPNQDDDQFARIWKLANKRVDEFGNETEVGKNGFKPYLTKWDKHPDRDQAWADEERNKIGEERFRREHECEFIAFDETLISSLFLSEMDLGMDPMRKCGQVRWYDKLRDDQTYMVALDPSLGTGGDPAAIQVFAIPGMRQIGEWQHNKTPIQMQIKIMKSILEEIEEAAPNSEIYYSVENNTLGEAALITIEEMGEENIPGTFLSEPKKRGKTRSFRKGFNTTHSSKLASCAKLKRWIEEDTMKIRSKNLTRELKTFVAKGNTFAAKDGETDDLVMSTILAVRMALQVSKYDPEAYAELKASFDDSDLRRPMPVGFL
tara:strand:- start:276 stop:1832 length:1557 start_codon:yes stop_codon:yes gene_type:complete